ncbi:MAG TPA: tRNA lysidine(34) synthetase TilS [Rhizomicrobium sp.]|nr:tRNA lysidine(34) synthetase TilS [Rhizomicrobium sp.]
MTRHAAPWPGAVAVSGGGDSLALMHLLNDWAKAQRQKPPVVLTVDHKLQPRSTANARRVVAWAKAAGLRAHVLTWVGTKPDADIEAEARQARYRLMGAWCKAKGIAALYVGHTRDDQAETFLLRLARGSGLDGLAAMRPIAAYPVEGFAGLRVVRPMIDLDRNAVRAHLTARGQEWLDDPMNSDPRFGRVRIRAALEILEASGLTRARIADAALHLGRAREALDAVTAAVLRRACRVEGETILVEAGALRAAPREVGLRALAQLLMAVSKQAYRPRFERLERLFDAILDDSLGAGRTLHGCRIGPARGSKGAEMLVIAREADLSGPKTGKKRRSAGKPETGS